MSSNRPHFATGRDVHELFRSKGRDIPVEVLKALRNQLSLRPGETALSLEDARLHLAQQWLELSPGAQDLFTLLEKRQQPTVEAVCLFVLEFLLTATSQYFVFQSLGHSIVKNLLTPRWLRKLASNLSGGHMELCLASLKLLNAVSNLAGGKEQKCLLESFPWDAKIFQKLLHMRRKDGRVSQDLLVKPDIRTLCLQFILSFLSSSSHTKALFLEQHRDIFLSIFKGINGDSYVVVHHILEILWTKLWQDLRLRKTLKVGLFGEKTILHLLKLYDRASQEGPDSRTVPADVVHHFLLAICTHRGVGVCFSDNGWYPRQEDESEASGREDRIHNKILASVLKMLRISEDARQQELALRILQSCPELVAGYLHTLSPMLEPRLSSGWLASIAFYGSVVSLPVSVESFYLPNGASSSSKAKCNYRPAPPPLLVVVNNILPSTIVKTHLAKALQSSHGLIQHVAGLLLVQCLKKFDSVQNVFRSVKSALEEDDVEGQWARRLTEIDREIRRRVPDINVVVAFSTTQQAAKTPSVKSAMLTELSHRLLWLYHRCMPLLMVEARYDIAKPLRALARIDDSNTTMEVLGLGRLQQLHILRMLSESEQFNWNAKPVSSGPSNLYVLLDLLSTAGHAPIRRAVSVLLVRALQGTLLFQHDPEELHVWLDALPATAQDEDAFTDNGARLGNERQCVISFFETCMLRCSKTPHRYLEDLESFMVSSSNLCSSVAISPVLVTSLEQLRAKLRSKTIEPSDVLSLVTFLRKVLHGLAGKQPDLGALHNIITDFRALVVKDEAFPEFPSIARALLRECTILDSCLAWCSSTLQTASLAMDSGPPQNLLNIIARAEQLKRGDVEEKRAITIAYGLVDRIRLLDRPLSSGIINRVASVIRHLYAPALSSLCLYLLPGSEAFWELGEEVISNWAPTYWILFHLDPDSIHRACHTSIFQMTLQKRRHMLCQFKTLAGFLDHRLRDVTQQRIVVHALEVLNILMKNAGRELPAQQFTSLRIFALFERQNLRQLACTQELPCSMVPALNQVFITMFDVSSDSDCRLLSPIRSHWVTATTNALEGALWESLSGFCVWVKFMSADEVLAIAEVLFRVLRHCDAESDVGAKEMLPPLIEALLSSLSQCDPDSEFIQWLNAHMASFLSLRSLVPDSGDLDKVLLRSVDSSLLFGYSVLQSDTRFVLRRVVSNAEVFWLSRFFSPPENAVETLLLCGSDWSIDRSNTIASIMYRSASARRSFWAWLSSETLDAKPDVRRLVPALIAACDCTSGNELLEGSGRSVLRKIFLALVGEFCRITMENDQSIYGSCITRMIQRFSTLKKVFLEELMKGLELLSTSELHLASLSLVRPLLDICPESVLPVVDAVINHSLQWAARHLSEVQQSADLNEHHLDKITNVARLRKYIAAHYAQPVIGSVIRRHSGHVASMQLIEALLKRTAQTPTAINRHLQGVFQHIDFRRLAATEVFCAERNAIMAVLYALFFACPEYTCQPADIHSLVQVYSGSLAAPDRRLLAIFFHFEGRGVPLAHVFTQWPQAKVTDQGTLLDSMLSLDPNRVLRTCLTFPDKRSFNIRDELVESRPDDGLLYDPVFLLLLFSSMLAECPPRTALSWVMLYRTNVVSFVIRCLSSTDGTIRRISLLQLGMLYKLMKAADMQEKEHIIHLLDLIRDLVKNPLDQADDNLPYLPSLTTLFLAHALRGIFYPSSFIYPISARFLLQRPRLDDGDVPLLYSTLLSSTDDWRRERGWIVRFLADGLLSGDDWRILRRRRTWDLLASTFQGSYDDRALRRSILEVLANLTCHARSAIFLVHRSCLLHWIAVQLLTLKRDEKIAWAKILENISVVFGQDCSGPVKKSERENDLVRCLTALVFDSDVSLLRLISRTLLRLDVARLPRNAMRDLMDAFLDRLRVFEDSYDIPLCATLIRDRISNVEALPPHPHIELHQPLFGTDLETWGRTVENLWEVSLRYSVCEPTWDKLTIRLLIWRALIGAEDSPLGEWARIEASHCLSLP